MAACNGGMVYDRYTNTPVSGWEKNDTLYYSVPAVKSGGTYPCQPPHLAGVPQQQGAALYTFGREGALPRIGVA